LSGSEPGLILLTYPQNLCLTSS